MEKTSQLLRMETLKKFEALEYGMFIHFGMSTFSGDMLFGDSPSDLYNPKKLDVNQWVGIARDAGMKYAVLTTKHIAGHCLWNSKYTDYTMQTSGNITDVLEKFVRACEEKGIIPGFYYSSMDNHHLFGNNPILTWEQHGHKLTHTTEKYREFQTKQIEELLTNYGNIGVMWVDIPSIIPMDYRIELYNKIHSLQSEIIVEMNHAFSNGLNFKPELAWPTDAMTLECDLPHYTGYDPIKTIGTEKYYLPAEHCSSICDKDIWFYNKDANLKSLERLLGEYYICRSNNVNFLLNVPPNMDGLISDDMQALLMKMKRTIQL